MLTNLQVTAFYFAAALVLLERGQGVLAYPLGVSKMRGFLREIATEKGGVAKRALQLLALLPDAPSVGRNEIEEYPPRLIALILADRSAR